MLQFYYLSFPRNLGIVQRQGIRNTLISYVGLAIGFVNTILILPGCSRPGKLASRACWYRLPRLGRS